MRAAFSLRPPLRVKQTSLCLDDARAYERELLRNLALRHLRFRVRVSTPMFRSPCKNIFTNH